LPNPYFTKRLIVIRGLPSRWYSSCLAQGVLGRYGYTVVGDEESLGAALSRGESVAVYVSEIVGWRVCDIARQYSVRDGAVQIQHAETLELSLIEVDPSVVKMVLVIPKECEAAVRQRYPRLLDICGVVERLA
jgi:hypothetical protein